VKSYFIESRTLPDGFVADTDVCIIGTGAAGLTVLRELQASGLSVIACEAGDLNPRAVDQALLRGDTPRDSYDLHSSRLRYFGGTANHWGGHCVPLEPYQMQRLPYIPYSGWPYGYDTLLPYYKRAAKMLELGDYDFDPESVAKTIGQRLVNFRGGVCRNVVSRYNRYRFGLALTDSDESLDRTQIFLCADLVNLALAPESSAIARAVFATTRGNSLIVRARYFLLATGGIETARLLLSMTRDRPAGLGNGHGLVGRFWQEHIWYPGGVIALSDPPQGESFYFREHSLGGYRVRAHIALTPKAEAEHGLPAFRAELAPVGLEYIKRSVQNGSIGLAEIQTLLRHSPDVTANLLCGAAVTTGFYLKNYFQMLADPENRVRLSRDRDKFGRPLPSLDFRVDENAHLALLNTQRLIGRDLAQRGVGRILIELSEDPSRRLPGRSYGAHHIGTARMSESRSEGVTNADARVHETDNLYLAGSSIFPTCGWQNPTLTIVATSMKLADHLKLRAQKEGRS
jgi:hypothetical protein